MQEQRLICTTVRFYNFSKSVSFVDFWRGCLVKKPVRHEFRHPLVTPNCPIPHVYRRVDL
jgi:hypothetical protein